MEIYLDDAVERLRHAEYDEDEIMEIVDVLGLTEEPALFDRSRLGRE